MLFSLRKEIVFTRFLILDNKNELAKNWLVFNFVYLIAVWSVWWFLG